MRALVLVAAGLLLAPAASAARVGCAAVEVTGHATGDCAAVAGLGHAEGPIAITGAGYAEGGWLALAAHGCTNDIEMGLSYSASKDCGPNKTEAQ